jgi:hypothetical protein
MTRRLKPLPRKVNEVVQDQLTPYNQPKASKDTVFTERRANNISQKDDKDKNFSIGLKDIDESIKYYFENVIKSSVLVKGQRVPVPILYGNQELWKAVQADGYTRDKNGKIMAPLIMFKRDTIEKNRTLGNKQDANNPSLYQVWERKYNNRNHYDAFSALTNRIPVKEYVMTIVPDYVTVTYSCVIFTEFMEQINPIIEGINYASDSYWGDLNRFKFKARIDQFSTIVEFNIGNDRAVKSTFNIVLSGYIIPETINKELASKNKFFSKSQIAFKLETSSQDLENYSVSKPKSANIGSTSILENTINISNKVENTINNFGIAAQLELAYVNIQVNRIAGSVRSNNVTFENVNLLPTPTNSALPATSMFNFKFFVNGQYIPSNQIVSMVEVGTSVNVVFDTDAMTYLLEGEGDEPDQISAIGPWKILDNSVEGALMTEEGYFLQTEDGSFIQYN